jgi:hypothetical protein
MLEGVEVNDLVARFLKLGNHQGVSWMSNPFIHVTPLLLSWTMFVSSTVPPITVKLRVVQMNPVEASASIEESPCAPDRHFGDWGVTQVDLGLFHRRSE